MQYRDVLFQSTLLLGLGLSTAALAADPTWVAATGTDSGICTAAAPCATFAYALNKTAAGGTIFVATSGSYGSIKIEKAVSIIAPDGVQATIYLPQTAARDGIQVNPGSGNVVLLKGLTVVDNNANAGFFADVEVDSGRVSIENCVLTTGNWGIYATSPDFLLIRNNHIENTVRGIENHANVANIYIGGNTISDNDYALLGAFDSYGDNTINGSSLCDICNATIAKAPFD